MLPKVPMLNFSQQAGIFDPKFSKPVTLIGAGSVGSQVALMLGKIGISEITAYDGDDVESHNIPSSAYGALDLALLKVEALRRIVLRENESVAFTAIPRMYQGEPLRNTVIACVDSMEARSLIWEEVKQNPLVDLFIDTRIAAELVSVFAVSPCDVEDTGYYEHFLYSSKDASKPMCGLHSIIYVSSIAASAVCANLTSWWQFGRKKLHFKILAGSLQTV